MIAALFSNTHAIGLGTLLRPSLSIELGTPREGSLEVLGNRPRAPRVIYADLIKTVHVFLNY